MNEKLIKQLRWFSYTALVFCAFWLVVLCIQNYNHLFCTDGSHIHWEARQKVVLVAITVLSVYIILTLALIATCSAFFINTLKGISQGVIFPKANINMINATAILIFLQTVAADNLSQAFISESPLSIALSSNPFVQSLAVLVFGIMYRIAYQLAEENELTV